MRKLLSPGLGLEGECSHDMGWQRFEALRVEAGLVGGVRHRDQLTLGAGVAVAALDKCAASLLLSLGSVVGGKAKKVHYRKY